MPYHDRKSTRLNSSHGSISYAVSLDRKSTRLYSSHGSISYAVSLDRKSTRLNSSHGSISYAVFCLKKKKKHLTTRTATASHPRLCCQHAYTPGPARTCLGPCATSIPALSSGRCEVFFFFFNDTATTEIYTLSLHDALPI